MLTCQIDDCGEAAHCKGMCPKHYARYVRHGDPHVVKKASVVPVLDRFWSRVEKTDGCWLWIGTKTSSGYGYFIPQGRKRVAAHRFSAALHFGMFDQRLHVLHLCDTPACVKPAHLELGDHVENMRQMAARGRTPNSQKTHCPKGHPYDEANTYVWKTNRYCRACNNAIRRERRSLVPAGAR
jgi:hypothetical protein